MIEKVFVSPVCQDSNAWDKIDAFSSREKYSKVSRLPTEYLTDKIRPVVTRKSELEFIKQNDWHSLELPDYQEFDAVVNLKRSSDDSSLTIQNLLIGTAMGEIIAALTKYMDIGNQVEMFLMAFICFSDFHESV